jgi:ABC-type uncharacterized transport system permease subunit
MKTIRSESKNKNIFEVFLEELSHSTILILILAVVCGLILSGLLIIITTEDVYSGFRISFMDGIYACLNTLGNTVSAIFLGAFGNPAEIAAAFQSGNAQAIRDALNPFFESLVVSTPYIFSGLALALSFRVGLLNIGAEGQIYIGAAGTAWAGYFFKGLPPLIHVPLALGIGALAGGFWAFIPGWLKAKTGAHEVINCIMMNYIAFNLVQYLIAGPMKDPTSYTPKTPWIEESAHLFRFFGEPIRFNIGFFIALLMAFLVWFLLFKTTWGYELRHVGLNPNASRYAGINITKIIVIGMALSGALAGLAGANEIMGVNFRQAPNFTSGYGFDGIALALLGNNHPVGVVISAIFFGFLRSSAKLMQLRAGIPSHLIPVLQAFIMFFIAAPAIVRTIFRLKQTKKNEIPLSDLKVSADKGK